jgi:hypothetical protein
VGGLFTIASIGSGPDRDRRDLAPRRRLDRAAGARNVAAGPSPGRRSPRRRA